MALVTTCPHCHTSFKVVADQLKLRRGLVRCGNCLTVFSGLDQLRRLEEPLASGEKAEPSALDAALAAQSALAPQSVLAPPPTADLDAGPEDYAPHRTGFETGALPYAARLEAGRAESGQRWPDEAGVDKAAIDEPVIGEPSVDEPAAGEPAAGEPVTDEAAAGEAPLDDGAIDEAATRDEALEALAREVEAVEARPLERWDALEPPAVGVPESAGGGPEEPYPGAAPTNIFRTPPARRAGAGATPAPADRDSGSGEDLEAIVEQFEAYDDSESAIDYFATEERRRGFVGRHGALKLLAAGVLVASLALQAVLWNRDWLAARFPALEPAVATLASPFGLEIALPKAIDSLSIQSFELQSATTPGLFAVSAILRNEARYPVRWPSMALTLTDPANRVLVRRIIDPADYLGAAAGDSGLRPRSERPIRLALEAESLQPAGYSVVLFYR